MRKTLFIAICLFSSLIMVGGSPLALVETTSYTTVEFTSVIHFLNSAGDNEEVGPGRYEVEAAESWLKLVPEGQSHTEAVLIEANQGTHEETLEQSKIRVQGDGENSDIIHLAILLPNGTGLEVIGTESGIRPRGVNLAFLTKQTGKSRRVIRIPNVKRKPSGKIANPSKALSSQVRAQPKISMSTSEVDCGPYIKRVSGGSDGAFSPTIAVYKNNLHIVYPRKSSGTFKSKALSLMHWEFVKRENRWGSASSHARKSLGKQSSKAPVALAVFQDRLHMVHIGKSSHNLYHSYFNGTEWSRELRIPDQKSKAAPALGVFNNQLHMVHLGDNSNDVWHSMYRGKGWTINKKVGIKSGHTPALGEAYGGLRMVSTDIPNSYNTQSKNLYFSWYNRKIWINNGKISGQLSKTTPAIIPMYNNSELHHFHLGKSSNNVWYSVWGTYPVPGTNTRRFKWWDEEKLSGISSNSPVSVVFHEGCMHMAYQKGKRILHATFPSRKVIE